VAGQQNQRFFSPRVDLTENKDNYQVKAELPGIPRDAVNIEFDDNTLVISGRLEHETSSEPERHDSPSQATDQSTAAQPAEDSTAVANSATDTQVAESTDDTPRIWHRERSVGEFSRSFAFNTPVDQENIKASLKDGILSIVLPKAAKTDTLRRIQVE